MLCSEEISYDQHVFAKTALECIQDLSIKLPTD